MSSTMTATVGLVVTALLTWYAAEWVRGIAEGQAMPLVRNPLALFWLAVRRLWRNRRFVGILLVCWFASAAIYWLVLDPLVYAPMRQEWQAQAQANLPESEPGIRQAPAYGGVFRGRAVIIGSGGISGNAPRHWILRGLPQFRRISLDGGTSGAGRIDLLALGILAMVLIVLWFRRPDWLPPTSHRQLPWPIYLTLGAFLVRSSVAILQIVSIRSAAAGEVPLGLPTILMNLLGGVYPLFHAFSMAVYIALLWHIIVQIGRGQYWNLRRAVIGAIHNWLAIAWLLLLIWLPLVIYSAVWAVVLPAGTAISSSWATTLVDTMKYIPTLLQIVLVFVPWIILAEQTSLIAALKRHLQLIYTHWWDLVVMLPRWLLVTVPVYALISTLSAAIEPRPQPSILWTSLGFAHSLVEVVVLVAVVVLYQQLSKTEPRPLEDMHQTLRGLWKTLWRVWKSVEHPAG